MEELPLVDQNAALDRLDGDNELWMELVSLCVEDVATLIESLRVALEKGDCAMVQMRAHTIKSAVGNIGAERLKGWAHKIEQHSLAGFLEDCNDSFVRMESCFRQTLDELKVLGALP